MTITAKEERLMKLMDIAEETIMSRRKNDCYELDDVAWDGRNFTAFKMPIFDRSGDPKDYSISDWGELPVATFWFEFAEDDDLETLTARLKTELDWFIKETKDRIEWKRNRKGC